MPLTITRYHDISCGHRVVGHEGKCRYLHGHNYRVHFTCRGPLDDRGRVLDFAEIKARLCEWLERCWDHRMILWSQDPAVPVLTAFSETGEGVVTVPFNPTAENMAKYLVREVGPSLLPEGVELVEVTIEETAKCWATYRK